MAKNDTAGAADDGPVIAPPEPDEFPLTLDEACARISATDKRVELIAAFHHVEAAAGRLRDLESAYRTRFAELADRPVR